MRIGSEAGALITLWPPGVIVAIGVDLSKRVTVARAIQRCEPVSFLMAEAWKVETVARLLGVSGLPSQLPTTAQNEVAFFISHFLKVCTQLGEKSHF